MKWDLFKNPADKLVYVNVENAFSVSADPEHPGCCLIVGGGNKQSVQGDLEQVHRVIKAGT